MPSRRATPLAPAFNGTVYPFPSLAMHFRAVKPVSHIDQKGYHFIGVRSLGVSQYELAQEPSPLSLPSALVRTFQHFKVGLKHLYYSIIDPLFLAAKMVVGHIYIIVAVDVVGGGLPFDTSSMSA
jgi:hypothetical protein